MEEAEEIGQLEGFRFEKDDVVEQRMTRRLLAAHAHGGPNRHIDGDNATRTLEVEPRPRWPQDRVARPARKLSAPAWYISGSVRSS